MVADVMTKPLGGEELRRQRDRLQLCQTDVEEGVKNVGNIQVCLYPLGTI
jgi:hypothetical protein